MMPNYRNPAFILIASVFLVPLIMYGIYAVKSGRLPFTAQGEWSIGIYNGASPSELTSPRNIKNPVLTADDVTDIPAQFVADPFIINDNQTWYMFFEVMNAQTRKGSIGFATSIDGLKWTYKQIVLDEPFHLSYPYVFKWNGDYYMIPESSQSHQLRLYKAAQFPVKWSFVKTLLNGNFKDSSIFFYAGKWWLFSEQEFGFLHLYFADTLEGPWIEHPQSPIIKGNSRISRPAGRILIMDNKVIRFAQDHHPIYGRQVRSFIVTDLTPATYSETEDARSPILQPDGTGWNADGMHQIDAYQTADGKWIACVDGFRNAILFGLKYR